MKVYDELVARGLIKVLLEYISNYFSCTLCVL